MFDLKMQADTSAVPVPLPGRVIIFVGPAGQLMQRWPDGRVAVLAVPVFDGGA